jgi:hypothetical protein
MPDARKMAAKLQTAQRGRMENEDRQADPVLANALSRRRQNKRPPKREPPVDTAGDPLQIRRGGPTREKGTTSTQRAVVAIIPLIMKAIHAVVATDQRARVIRMNGRGVTGRLVMQNSIDSTHISFPLDDGSFENLHAKRLGDGAYVLDNSPFYAYNVSFGDVVTAIINDGKLMFSSVSKRGGHSTYRVRLPKGKSHEYFLVMFDEIGKLGCTFEGSGAKERRLYSIDVPPYADIKKVYSILEEKEENEQWEFEEAHFFEGYAT